MKRTLVLGASEYEWRYSNKAIKKLLKSNIEVLAVGKSKGNVLGIDIHNEKVLFEDIHTVTMYLNPKNQMAYYDYIIALKPKRVIFNPGTENPELVTLLKEHGIEADMACTLVLLSTNQY